MPLVEKLRVLDLAPDEALLIDRRHRLAQELATELSGYAFQQFSLPAIEGDQPLLGVKLTFPLGIPPVLEAGKARYTRLMDHIFFPELGDVNLSKALFDIVATEYEKMIDPEFNKKIYRALMRLASDGQVGHLKILDFGCGTGIGFRVCAEGEFENVSLCGFDTSHEMLSIAKARGDVIDDVGFEVGKAANWSGIIASFVFHYGVSDTELTRLAYQLKPSGRLVGNYFKASGADLETFEKRCDAVGLTLVEIDNRYSTDHAANPILLFKKVG